MNIELIIKDGTTAWQREQPAQGTVIERLVAESGFALPTDYVAFLKVSNGGEGELGISPGWFHIWSAEEVLDANHGYQVADFHPGYFGFGSSLGGIMFAFKLAELRSTVYGIPFDSIDPNDIEIVADDFLAFVRAMGHSWDE